MSPHRAQFVSMVQKHGWQSGAELGVDKGVLFNMLLTGCPNLSLIGVDTGVVPKRVAHCHAIVEDFPDRARLYLMTTNQAASMVPDHSLDFVFIDADHSASAVTQDIAHWQPKVKKGGWLGGHDYNKKFPGVVQAVQKAFGSKIQQYQGSIWGVWL